MVRGLEKLAFKERRAVRMVRKEAQHLVFRRGAAVSAEQRIAPVLREEDVPGTLDLRQLFESGIDVG